MFILKNNQLQVSILDPVADQFRLGSRYCTGGYIWQIEDLSRGNLLSGPHYPDPSPPQFDGQGAPEVFETALGQDTCNVHEDLLVIGVGKVKRTSDVSPFHVRNNPHVSKFCTWEIRLEDTSVSMETDQTFNQYSLHLERQVIISERTVVSKSRLFNTGSVPIPVRWFSHPFFPHTKEFICCSFSQPVEVPVNQGFYLDDQNRLCMNREYQWKKGCYCPLNMHWGQQVTINQFHDLLNNVKVTMNFPLAWMPVWANAATFSFEPYLDQGVAPGNDLQWQIGYEF